MRHGHHVSRDSLAALVAVRHRHGSGSIDLRWTAGDVATALTTLAPLWCSRHGVAIPGDLGATLSTYLRYLAAHRCLAPGSDRPAELRRAVQDLDDTPGDARARHPSRGRRPTAPVLPLR